MHPEDGDSKPLRNGVYKIFLSSGMIKCFLKMEAENRSETAFIVYQFTLVIYFYLFSGIFMR